MKTEWLLKRNCSLSPRQAAHAYGMLCALLLGIGLGFTVWGAWWVLAFVLIEIGATVLALLHYARHACDREHIVLSENCLLVERIEGEQVCAIRLDPYWARIAVPDRRRRLIQLESRGVKVAVGGFVSEEAREQLAAELRTALRASSLLLR
jgi:uncharacterized membrane protein